MQVSYEVHSSWKDELGKTIHQLDLNLSMEGNGRALEQIKNVIDTICITITDIVGEIETQAAQVEQA